MDTNNYLYKDMKIKIEQIISQLKVTEENQPMSTDVHSATWLLTRLVKITLPAFPTCAFALMVAGLKQG